MCVQFNHTLSINKSQEHVCNLVLPRIVAHISTVSTHLIHKNDVRTCICLTYLQL